MQTIILFLDTETISYRATSLWFSILTSNSSKTHILNVMKEENTPQRWSRILTKILPQPKFSQENFRRMYEVEDLS
jgi:L-rhamnose mutarotase